VLTNPIHVRMTVKIRGRELVKTTALSTEHPEDEDAMTALGVQLRKLGRLPSGPLTATEVPQEVRIDVLSGLPVRHEAIWIRAEKIKGLLDEKMALLEFVKEFEGA
jgi:hypothetical protein